MNKKLNFKKKNLTYLLKTNCVWVVCVSNYGWECMVDDPFYVAGGMAPLKKGLGHVSLCNGM